MMGAEKAPEDGTRRRGAPPRLAFRLLEADARRAALLRLARAQLVFSNESTML